MTPRRILLVLPGGEMGGSERQALHIATLMRDCFSWVPAIAATGDGPLLDAARDAGIAAISLPPLSGRWPVLVAWRQRRAASQLAAFAAEVVLPFTWPANTFCALQRHRIGATTVCWNQRDVGLLRGDLQIEARALAQCDLFIANSPSSAAHLVALGINGDRVRILPNVVTTPVPKTNASHWRTRLGLNPEQALVVMAANFTAAKDHATALVAWRRLLDRRPRPWPMLVLAGRADATAGAMRHMIVDLGLGDHVRLPGAVDDIDGLIAAADVVLHATRSEGCPNAILEAMAAGRSIVASDLPGCRFALGEAGLYAQMGDADAHADALCRLLDDASLRRELGQRARARIAECFSVEAVAPVYAAAFAAQICASNAAGKPMD